MTCLMPIPSIMFGPDICGYTTKKVHAIITYKGKNLLLKPEVTCETDQLTHVYTLVIKPDNTYKILIDNVEKQSGGLYEDWDFLAPRQIPVPEAKKVRSSSCRLLALERGVNFLLWEGSCITKL